MKKILLFLQEVFVRKQPEITSTKVAVPGFGQGFAGAIDFFGVFVPTIEDLRGGAYTSTEACAAAIARDWELIGKDLRQVLGRHEDSRKVAGKYGTESPQHVA